MTKIAKLTMLGVYALALLVVGCLAAQVLWRVIRHRSDSPDSGYYYGAVHARFSGTDDELYEFNFDGKTEQHWRSPYFTNFAYQTLQFEWDRFDSRPSLPGDKGIITLPSLAYESTHGTGVLTRVILSDWLLGTTNASAGGAQSVDAVFGLIEAAGRGTLPAPNHAGYLFQKPARVSIQHFQLGFGVGLLVYIWIGVWLVLVVVFGPRIARSHCNKKVGPGTA